MPKAPAAKTRQRSEEEILDQATRQLLQATKRQAKKNGKQILFNPRNPVDPV